ncbi:MAG: hypothetical protein MJ032_01890 [Acidaminococcaceae bacterium]|nr:hypothetical protein [Acidaminococcaceae bacterium]
MLSVQNEQTKEKLELQKGDEKEETTEYKEPSFIKYFFILILAILIIWFFHDFCNTHKISRELSYIISMSVVVVALSYLSGVFSNKKKTIDRVQNFLTVMVCAVIIGFKGYTGEWDGQDARPKIFVVMLTVVIISAVLRRIYEKFVKGENKNE